MHTRRTVYPYRIRYWRTVQSEMLTATLAPLPIFLLGAFIRVLEAARPRYQFYPWIMCKCIHSRVYCSRLPGHPRSKHALGIFSCNGEKIQEIAECYRFNLTASSQASGVCRSAERTGYVPGCRIHGDQTKFLRSACSYRAIQRARCKFIYQIQVAQC